LKTIPLEDLHNAIFNSFFLTEWKWPLIPCDETWNQEEEISLFDTGDVPGEQKNRVITNYPIF
jgi:hypothetical protein